MPMAPAIGTLWAPRKSDMDSPIPVVSSLMIQKTIVISGTFAATGWRSLNFPVRARGTVSPFMDGQHT